MYGPTMIAVFERKDKGQGPIELTLCSPIDEAAVVRDATEWINDNRTRMFLRRNNTFTQSYEADWIKKCNSDEGHFHWRIYADGVHIGGCGLHGISSEHGFAELGLMIGRQDYWGKGIAQVAEIMVTEYGFNNIVAGGLHRIEAGVAVRSDDRGNDASRGAVSKIGYREVGVLRESLFCQGTWYDTWLCELLASEWEKIGLAKMKQSGIVKLDLYPGCEDKGFVPILIE